MQLPLLGCSCVSGPNGSAATCVCVAGYQGNGTFCKGKITWRDFDKHSELSALAKFVRIWFVSLYLAELDLCHWSNGGCSQNAVCTKVSAGERTCTCREGYTGDGVVCLGTLDLNFDKKGSYVKWSFKCWLLKWGKWNYKNLRNSFRFYSIGMC